MPFIPKNTRATSHASWDFALGIRASATEVGTALHATAVHLDTTVLDVVLVLKAVASATAVMGFLEQANVCVPLALVETRATRAKMGMVARTAVFAQPATPSSQPLVLGAQQPIKPPATALQCTLIPARTAHLAWEVISGHSALGIRWTSPFLLWVVCF